MTPEERRGRGVLDALARGTLAVAANPEILVAPLALLAATFVGIGLFVAAAVLPIGLGALRSSTAALRGDPRRLVETLGDLGGRFVALPAALVSAFVAALVLGTLLMLLAAWLKAGTIAVLLAAERAAPQGGRREAFRLPEAGGVFTDAARRFAGRFFWLLNLNLLAATLLIALMLLPFVALLWGFSSGHFAPAVLLLLLAIPVVIVGGVALRLAYLAAAWAIVEGGLGVLDGVARGLARLREALGRSIALYLLLVAVGGVTAAAFALPRVLLTTLLGARPGHAGALVPFLAITFAFVLLQTLAGLALDVVVTGSFVSLWSGAPPVRRPPVLFAAPPRVEAAPPSAPAVDLPTTAFDAG